MLQTFTTSLILALLPAMVFGQTTPEAYLKVHSNLSGSLVLVDSAYAGTAGQDGVITVTAGHHKVVVTPTNVGSWVLSRPEADIYVSEDDTLDIRLDFPITYRIDTIPFGATVLREDDDRVLGETPLVFTSETALHVALILEKNGYATERVVPGTEVVNRHSVSLRPLEDQVARSDAVEWEKPSSSGKWITYSALGLVVAGGALAVHFKFKADDKYDEYLQTADSATKDEVDRLDRMSYVALGGMQVGLGVLAYRLAF
jgi:hypothetical protein